MRLLFLTGSRGEWGYIRPVLRLCVARGIDYRIVATNMHVLPQHGRTVDEIAADGFEVSDRIYMAFDGHDRTAHAKSLGAFAQSFADVLERVKPDWLVLAGDRGEQLMGAVAGGYTYTPTAHIQAGELSGNIDGVARHALGKFAHLHFAANEDAAQRLVRLGEDPWRVHTVGAPQLDELGEATPTRVEGPYILAVQHACTEETSEADAQARVTIAALREFGMPVVWVMPNNDAGSDAVRRAVLGLRTAGWRIVDNLRRADFLGLMRDCRAMIGNSSSALIEAPSFGIPAVNLGRRQADRVRGENVLDCGWDGDVLGMLRHACSDEFRASLRGMANPYGDGRSAKRILDVLQATRRDDRLLVKRLTY